MAIAVVGSSVLISALTEDEATGLFPQAEVQDSAGAAVGAAIDLSATGADASRYQGSWTVTAAGRFDVKVKFYTDAPHSTKADYAVKMFSIYAGYDDDVADAVWTEDLRDHLGDTAAQSVLIAAAQGGDRVRSDAIAYDANDRPTSIRTRIFDTAVNAAASTPGATGETGEIVTITETATHTSATRWESLLRRVT